MNRHSGYVQSDVFETLWTKLKGTKESDVFGKPHALHSEEHDHGGLVLDIWIPDTVVFRSGKPVGWYFTAQRPGHKGRINRRYAKNMNKAGILSRFTDRRNRYVKTPWLSKRKIDVVAQFMCEVTGSIIYFNEEKLTKFLDGADEYRYLNDGILQKFVVPHSEHNDMIRAVWTRGFTFLEKMTNMKVIHDTRIPVEDRACTYDKNLSAHCETQLIAQGAMSTLVNNACVLMSDHIVKVHKQMAGNSGSATDMVEERDVKAITMYLKHASNGKLYLLWIESVEYHRGYDDAHAQSHQQHHHHHHHLQRPIEGSAEGTRYQSSSGGSNVSEEKRYRSNGHSAEARHGGGSRSPAQNEKRRRTTVASRKTNHHYRDRASKAQRQPQGNDATDSTFLSLLQLKCRATNKLDRVQKGQGGTGCEQCGHLVKDGFLYHVSYRVLCESMDNSIKSMDRNAVAQEWNKKSDEEKLQYANTVDANKEIRAQYMPRVVLCQDPCLTLAEYNSYVNIIQTERIERRKRQRQEKQRMKQRMAALRQESIDNSLKRRGKGPGAVSVVDQERPERRQQTEQSGSGDSGEQSDKTLAPAEEGRRVESEDMQLLRREAHSFMKNIAKVCQSCVGKIYEHVDHVYDSDEDSQFKDLNEELLKAYNNAIHFDVDEEGELGQSRRMHSPAPTPSNKQKEEEKFMKWYERVSKPTSGQLQAKGRRHHQSHAQFSTRRQSGNGNRTPTSSRSNGEKKMIHKAYDEIQFVETFRPRRIVVSTVDSEAAETRSASSSVHTPTNSDSAHHSEMYNRQRSPMLKTSENHFKAAYRSRATHSQSHGQIPTQRKRGHTAVFRQDRSVRRNVMISGLAQGRDMTEEEVEQHVMKIYNNLYK